MQGENLPTDTTASEPFVVMAKPVGPRCNLECSYCYYTETESFYDSPHRFLMPDSLLETYIRRYIAASPGPDVQFIWHGGEPTLAGLDFFRRTVALQKRYLPEGWSCWNNLQTNGILLDDEWCSFLAGEHFDVGLSIDGTQWLHDENRKDHGGSGTYGRAVAAARRLQAHGIQPDLLCTVTSAIAKEPLAVYRALRELDTGWIQFIPIVRRTPDGRLTADSVSGKELGDFLCAVFDEWLHHDLGRLDIQLFAEMSLVWAGGTGSLCWMAPTCGRVLVVEHDGSVYSCDHFVNQDHRIGDIETASLSTLVDLPFQRLFGSRKQTGLPLQCRSCSWLTVCNGGCPKDRIALTENGEPGLNCLCDGFRQFFAHAEKPMEQVMQLRKRGLTHAAIMAQMRAESAARWRGVGRNDPCPCGSGRKAKQCCWSSRPKL
ncbi:MAG TPA: anaerobic sulfatase maturase [Anaerovoracaceae bacterium]|nr:anaerobic sulfatase maturase [Anaerovoracaceae bacterium]